MNGSDSALEAPDAPQDLAPDLAPDAAQEQAQPPQPEPDAGQDSGFDPPFALADVPEEYRDHVDRYVRQARASVLQAKQQFAEQRKAVEAEREAIAEYERLAELDTRLRDPGTRLAAAQEFLDAYGLEYEAPGGEDPYGGPAAEEDAPLPQDPRLEELWQREEQREEQERLDYLRGHVEDAIGTWSEREGRDMTENERQFVISQAAVLPAADDGLPDMEAALAQLDAYNARLIEDYIQSKKATVPAAGGESGVPAFSPSNTQERLAAANAVAARHLG